ncbi:DUF222 domain-containing protein [Pseudarthrobacter sulfonivorans]|uniref:HNH endonuclease signature motif containing protein n=1 Tax=Pseudarthrobacter sulfonivorans TaxID=121292 RepID=UPI00285CF7F6|nr:DUF222 domain-containing protein [Pseudarthrobacter sulfonivorans]MDR6414152.1 hypothetical protein [Pseudarthrobacter sulfonivorans]
MERRAAVEAAEALAASAAALAAALKGPASVGPGEADPLRQMVDDFLDALAGTSRIDAQVAAVRVHLTAGYVGAAEALAPPAVSLQDHTAQEMALVAELAGALTVSEPAAADLVAEAHELMTALPLTMSALQAGSISWRHARVMVDETSGLGPEGAQALEAHFLDPEAPNPLRGCPAGEMVAGRFRARARTWRERHHPVSIEKRHTKCATDRRVLFSPARDGMAWLSAYLPADTASGIWERTTAAARALQGPEEPRTLTQLRADIAATWLLGGSSGGADNAGPRDGVPSPRAQVLITVPVMALLGVTEEPAMLDGYGPIPPSMARQLIADGATSFHRVLIDPRDGAPLEIGRTSYPVTKAQRQWLRLRDGKCPFPGCSNQSLDNEADHVLAWAKGGITGISNLGQPCRKHHQLRHTTAWTPTTPTKDQPPGWISPSGRHYQSEHPDWEPPTWPEPARQDGQGAVELSELRDGLPLQVPLPQGPEPQDGRESRDLTMPAPEL